MLGYTGDGTTGNCQAVCGDGILVSPDEQCDDGNMIGGDGCSMNCQRETPTCTLDIVP